MLVCAVITHSLREARVVARQCLDEDLGTTLGPADEGGLPCGGRLVRLDVDRLCTRRGRPQQLLAHDRANRAAMAVGQQAAVPDAMQAGGPHMQQEAVHELGAAQGHDLAARAASGEVGLENSLTSGGSGRSVSVSRRLLSTLHGACAPHASRGIIGFAKAVQRYLASEQRG